MNGFLRELRRRKVFRMAGFYVVGAWLVMQAADVFFPGWGLPDSAINVLLVAAVVGFPLALVFGWFYDITTHGIVRTPASDHESPGEPLPLQRMDFVVLVCLAGIAATILYQAGSEIVETPRMERTEGQVLQTDQLAPVEKRPNSIAVLPFTNISSDPENEIFCDGISEEILSRLGTSKGLYVIGRTSSWQFKGSDYGIPRISRLLGVRYLLQGSVRKQDDRLRISAQLVDDTGAQIWSDIYDRRLDDIFAIQAAIADEVASTVAPQIAAPATPQYEPPTEAYLHFLAGREWLNKRELAVAREQLSEAIEIDPAFAAAYAERGISRILGYFEKADLDAADRDISTALRLQPELPRALAARGFFLRAQPEPDLAASEAMFREALDSDPNMVDAMIWLGGVLRQQGRYDEAHDWITKAWQTDPLHAAVAANVARYLGERGQLAEVEQILLPLTDLPEPNRPALIGLATLYKDTGRLVELNTVAKRLAMAGGRVHLWLVISYSVLGDYDTAATWAARSAGDRSGTSGFDFLPAISAFLAGQFDEAFGTLRDVLDEKKMDLAKSDPSVAQAFGLMQAMTGQCDGAARTLGIVFGEAPDRPQMSDMECDTHQAVAWCLKSQGIESEAHALLSEVRRSLTQQQERTGFLGSQDTYRLARNAVLVGDTELALRRLERAVDLGWRDYYINNRDPRWGLLQDDPGYQALMAKVKADVDRQRAEVERIDAEENFPALLDQVRATKGD